jgi:hypothetical protein
MPADLPTPSLLTSECFTFRQGRRYHATVKLSGIEQLVSNELIAERFRGLGFTEIEVKGGGPIREAQVRWTGPGATTSIDGHLEYVFELRDQIGR